jgi:hypothetical protein
MLELEEISPESENHILALVEESITSELII